MKHPSNSPVRARKPEWLKLRLPSGPEFEKTKGMIRKDRLHTVCQEAGCPNIWECFSHHTATFLILGSRCTRNCRFCAVTEGPLEPPDPQDEATFTSARLNHELRRTGPHRIIWELYQELIRLRKAVPALANLSFKPGDKVKVREGPFENFEGVVEEINSQKGTVRVIVMIFGRSTPIEIEYWQVEQL